MGVALDSSVDDVDWEEARRDLAEDDFDNGRSPAALARSFAQSQRVVFAREGTDRRVIGMARLLSDGVCNAYLLDVWTHSAYRHRGIGASMVRHLVSEVPGQHVGLQTEGAIGFYSSLGFRPQPEFMSRISGRWLENEANR